MSSSKKRRLTDGEDWDRSADGSKAKIKVPRHGRQSWLSRCKVKCGELSENGEVCGKFHGEFRNLKRHCQLFHPMAKEPFAIQNNSFGVGGKWRTTWKAKGRVESCMVLQKIMMVKYGLHLI